MKLALRGVLCAPLALMAVGPAWAQGIVSELQIGILAHDVPIVGEQKEHGADINGELRFVSPVPNGWIAGIAPGAGLQRAQPAPRRPGRAHRRAQLHQRDRKCRGRFVVR